MKKQLLSFFLIVLSIAASGQVTSTAAFSSTSIDTTVFTGTGGSPDSLIYKNEHTIETYFKCSSLTGQHTIFVYLYGSTPTYLYRIYRLGDTIYATNNVSFNLKHRNVDTNWHHLAITRNSSDSLSMFFDGIKVDAGASGPLPTFVGEKGFIIGNDIMPASKFAGNLTQFRISPSVLYSDNFPDTCIYNNSFFYASMNNVNNTDVIINGLSYHIHTTLSLGSPCDTTALPPVDTTTAVPTDRNGGFQIFPNPTHRFITIKSSIPISKVTIQNVVGQVVYAQQYYNLKNVDISTELFPEGVYFVKVDDNKVYRIIKR